MKALSTVRTLRLICIITILLGVGMGRAEGTSNLAHVDQSADEDGTWYGVNYLSAYNHYEPQYLSDEILDRDFGLFKSQGLEYVTLVALWEYLEPQLGEYNDTAINELIRVCDFASRNDLRVIIDFHTMMTNNSWTMPVWLSPRKFETIFTDATGTARQAWLNFLNYCASRLNSSESIWSWHMMNEPARKSWACDVSIEDFLQLWTDMKAVFKSYSPRPVSIRFTPQVFDDPDHFNRDPRVYGVCDYIALNWYEVYCSRELFSDIVEDASSHTEVIVSEFGTNVTDDYDQADLYRQYVDLFHSLDIRDCVAWMWRADYDGSEVEPPGVGYNLAKDFDGTPRPAFYLLRDDSATQAYLVVRGAHDEIFYRPYNCMTSSWDDWRVIPEGATCDSPAAAVYSSKLHFVVRGMDRQSLWFGWVNLTDYSFSGWQSISGATQSAPTLVNYDSKLVLVVRGLDNSIYHRLYDCVSGVWEGWSVLPNGSTIDSPAAAVLEGVLHIVVRGADGYSVWHSSVNMTTSDFSGWELIGGATESKPTLAWSESRLELYLVVRGLDNVVYYNVWNGVDWEGWTSLSSGATCDSPGATVIDNKLHIVVRGMDEYSLWHMSVDLTTSIASDWALIDGATNSAPTLIN